MSAIIREIYWQEYDTTTQIRTVRADIICDAIADLPSGGIMNDYKLDIGSRAKVIADGSEWEIQSTGSWVRQPGRLQLDLTGYATNQYVDTGLAAKVDTITYTAGQAAQDDAIRALTGQGREIPADSDLDNYAQIGLYQIATTAVAGSIINMPSECKVAGSIQIIRLNGSALAQVYRPNWASTGSRVGGYYIRQRTGASAWTAWYRFDGTQV